MNNMQSSYSHEGFLARLAQRWAFRPRHYVFGFDLGVDANDEDDADQTVAENRPFCALQWSFGSIRDYDPQIVAVTYAGTEEFRWISEPELVDACIGRSAAGGSARDLGPSIVRPNSKITIRIRRLWVPDPAETYPGPEVESQIHIVLSGVDLLVPRQGDPVWVADPAAGA